MQKRYHTLENIIFDAIVYLVMAFVLICCLVPFIYMLAVSFSGTKPLINGEVFLWPKDFTLDSYKQIFTYPNFFKAYGNTFLYAVGGTAIALIMTSLMAYPLSKTFLWGNKFFTKMVVVTMFFSGGLIPNYLLLNSLHLVGTRAAMLMPFAINSFNLIILINFFRSIPNEIEEAALIDGLGYFGILRRIVLPLSTAAIATIGLYYAVFFWNDWFNSLIYLKSGQYHGHRHGQRLGGKDDHCHLGEIRGHHHIHRTHYRDLSLPSEIFRQGLDHWGRKGMSAFPSSAEPTKGYASHEEACPVVQIKTIGTEQRNPNTLEIDRADTAEILRLMNEEDKKVAPAVEQVLPQVEKAVDVIYAHMRCGGRLIYCGCGTSGRLGVLDASECPPTFGVEPGLVRGVIAGGPDALTNAAEGAEDHFEDGAKDLQALDFRAQDVLVGIAASGRTPYVLGAMDYARALGAPVIGLTCCPGSAIDTAADIGIAPQPGPEVVTGSTRLKSGTAQKMVLNMLSTAVMVKLGKVYSNLMVDVCASNQKLVARAVSIVCCATGVSPERARGVLDEAGFSAKTAIVMILCGVDAGEAHALLQRVDGQVSAAVLSRPDGVQTDAFVRRL